MENLFKNLPRDLQWEILTDWVGTHVVRYNKLRRKMTREILDQLKEETKNSYFYEHTHLILKQYPCFYGDGKTPWYWRNSSNPAFLTITQVVLGIHGNIFGLFKNRYTGDLFYGFYSRSHKWIMSTVVDNITLSPYVTHQYSSYPFTNKKMGRAGGEVVRF